ncbi:5-formyltetrahydrofolate cyclo-ligase [Escherichia coli]|nr:5-formyltetrahydrofolate cyclo-ligase [Escherichia coli]
MHIRQQIRDRRRALTPEQQRLFAQQAAEPDDGLSPGGSRSQRGAVFLSFDGELDTQPLIDQLWRAGKRVYLPVLHPFSARQSAVFKLPSAEPTGDEPPEDPRTKTRCAGCAAAG